MGTYMTSVGTVLKLIRVHRDVSQGDMAETLGVTQNFLSQLENGKKTVSATKLEDFAKCLGLSREILILASCDVPRELSDADKKEFLNMKKAAMQILLLE